MILECKITVCYYTCSILCITNINHIFPCTSLEGRNTWSKMVEIDQNRRGSGGGITVALKSQFKVLGMCFVNFCCFQDQVLENREIV